MAFLAFAAAAAGSAASSYTCRVPYAARSAAVLAAAAAAACRVLQCLQLHMPRVDQAWLIRQRQAWRPSRLMASSWPWPPPLCTSRYQ